MNEAKWISLNDRVKICLTSIVKKYCTDALLGGGNDVIGVRVESRHAPAIRKAIAKILDIEDSDSSSVIAVMSNDKIEGLIPFVETNKPSRLYDFPREQYKDDVIYCKNMMVFLTGRRNDDVEARLYNNYDMGKLDISNYAQEAGMVYIYQNRSEFIIVRSGYSGNMIGVHRGLYDNMVEVAKRSDFQRATSDSLNMSEFLRKHGIESSDRLVNLMNARSAKGIIDEKTLNKRILTVIDAFETVKNDLILLQFLKLQLKEMGGGQKVLEEFEKSCKELVDREYTSIVV